MTLALFIAATIADLVTSIIARRNPRLGEGGPLKFAGRYWIVARIALAVAIAVIALTWPAYGWALVVGTVLYFAVAASNTVQIVRAS